MRLTRTEVLGFDLGEKLTAGVLPYLYAGCAIGLLMAMLMRRSSRGYRVFRTGFATAITGRKGNGKSLLSVHELLRHAGVWTKCKKCSKKPELRERFGAVRARGGGWGHFGHIATNCTIDLPAKLQQYWIHVRDWDDLAAWVEDGKGNMTVEELLPHCTLVSIDEMHLWCPASAQVLPKREKLFLSQLRKLCLELIYATQSIGNVSVGLRRQTDEIAVCRKGLFGAMKVNFYDPDELPNGTTKKGVKPLWTYRYRVSKRVANAYDTFEMLMPSTSDSDNYAQAGSGQRREAVRAAGRAVFDSSDFDVVTSMSS